MGWLFNVAEERLGAEPTVLHPLRGTVVKTPSSNFQAVIKLFYDQKRLMTFFRPIKEGNLRLIDICSSMRWQLPQQIS